MNGPDSARPRSAAPAAAAELKRQLLGLMLGRAAVLTLLLVVGILIERLLPQAADRIPFFYALTGAGYFLTALYAIAHRWWARHASAAYVQLGGDLLLVTGLVYVTGAVDSPFSVLYFTVIIASSILLRRRGAFFTATASWLLYGLIVLLIVYHLLPLGPGWEEVDLLGDVAAIKLISYSLFVHFLAFFAVAALSSMLAEKLHRAGRALEEKTEDLARLQTLSKNIVDSITSGVITTDLTGKITFMNRHGEEIYGSPATSFLDKPVWEVLGQPPDFLARITDGLGRDQRQRIDSSVSGPGGTTIVLGIACSVLKDQRGGPTGFIFGFQNLTEIKALEEEVRVKDRMAALGSMAAGMAHEIRNPLASMSGSAQLLRKTLRLTEADGELFDIVIREGRRLDRIIQDFLLFARPGRFRPESADLVPILCESLLLLKNGDEYTPAHGIRTVFPEDCVMARVDVNVIRQVFWNLAKNGLRAMPKGGTLAVRAERTAEGSALVTFTDEGVGMTPEELEVAFQPFHGSFQGGTGLGLAIVFRVVEEHGGRIKVRSRPGEGTTITVELPAPVREAAETAAERAGAAAG